MSDNNIGGIFGSLILGVGFALLLMLPVILMGRFWTKIMSFVVAAGMTGLVLLRPSMLEWLSEEQKVCTARACPADALYGLMTALPTWCWWSVVITSWLVVVHSVWSESNRHPEVGQP